MKLPSGKVLVTLRGFGSTRSASIPSSMAHAPRGEGSQTTRNIGVADAAPLTPRRDRACA